MARKSSWNNKVNLFVLAWPNAGQSGGAVEYIQPPKDPKPVHKADK